MIIKLLAAGAVVCALSASAALAQDVTYKPSDPLIDAKQAQYKPVTDAERATAAAAANGNYVIIDGEVRIPVNTDVAAKVGIPVEIVASAPVPDTKENRALYGGPLSNAGTRTRAAGN